MAVRVTCEGRWVPSAGRRDQRRGRIYGLRRRHEDGPGREGLAKADGPYHHDLCYHDGRVYVAWSNFFNSGADSHVGLRREPRTAGEAPGPGGDLGAGMNVQDGHFFVIGGLPTGIDELRLRPTVSHLRTP